MSREPCPAHLVLIETSGNQRYIFSTNKLREQVGASELIYLAGTNWVLDAVRAVGGPDLTASAPDDLRRKLLDRTLNVPLEQGANVEVILAASGKALLLVRDGKLGKEIVRRVTERALREAPGLDITGVVSNKEFDLATDPIHEQIRQVHELHTAVRSRLPGPVSRFQRIPIVAECRTSGGPAARLTEAQDRIPKTEWGVPISHASLAKARARKSWEDRLAQILAGSDVTLAQNLEAFEQESWVAVVHADGNGLGQVFLNFDKAITPAGDTLARNREYIDKLRSFSLQLDECSQRAFLETCKKARHWLPKKRRRRVPVIPLILGGDDLTVICSGAIGLRFAATYSEEFEKAAGRPGSTGLNVSEIVKAAREDGASGKALGLTCSVGVAVVKPHFPFHAAYDLVEELLRSAKQLKPDPAIDFQIVYDSSASTLEQARRAWRLNGGTTELTARPYRLRERDGELTWKELQQRAHQLADLSRSESGDRLPRSQLQFLREAIFEGKEVAEAQLQLIRRRYSALEPILWDGKLFFTKPTESGAGEAQGPRWRTHLLDLLEVEGLEREASRKRT